MGDSVFSEPSSNYLDIYMYSSNNTPAYYPTEDLNDKPRDGSVRFYGNTLQYYNAMYGMWTNMYPDNHSLMLAPDTKAVIEWAKKKMKVEEEEKSLLEQFPNLKRAKENYELLKDLLVDELVKEENS